MTLKELQSLIKEEFEALTQEVDADDDLDVNVDSDEVEAEEKNPEDTLRNVFDMLKDYFEGGEEMGDEEMGNDMEDVEGEEEPEADLEERASQGFGDPGVKNSAGPNAGFTPAKTSRGDGKLHEGKSALQERFQKLANIIK